MASGIFYPATGGDDGYWEPGDFQSGYNRLAFGSIDIGSYVSFNTFIRFTGINIPQGASISAAYLKLTSHGSLSGTTVNVRIFFNDIDDAVAPTSIAEANGLALTTSFTDWDAIAAWIDGVQYDSPSIVSILQEVVNRGGWSSGNSMIALLKNNVSSDGAYREAEAIDYVSVEKAELHIEWAVPIEIVCPEPFLSESSLSAIIEPSWDEIFCPVPFLAQASLQSSPAIEVAPARFTAAGTLQAQPEFQIFTGGALIATSSMSATIEEPFSVAALPRAYTFILTGEADGIDDVVIPISSFQSRIKSDDPTYLSVVIPGTDWSSEINARLNGELIVKMGYRLNNEIVLSEIIAQVTMDGIRIDEGTSKQSITLDGYKTELFIHKEVDLKNPVYMNLDAGKLRYRCTPDLYLKPGDTVNINDDSFIVDTISFSVSAELETYEIAE